MDSVVDVLRRARALITPEGAWTRKCLARTVKGYPIGPLCGGAVRWCIEGACQRASDTELGWLRAIKTIETTVGTTAYGFNDAAGRTHAEVIAAFDRAIALAEQGPVIP